MEINDVLILVYDTHTVDLLVIPRSIAYNGQTASMPGDDRKRFMKLVESAREGFMESI